MNERINELLASIREPMERRSKLHAELHDKKRPPKSYRANEIETEIKKIDSQTLGARNEIAAIAGAEWSRFLAGMKAGMTKAVFSERMAAFAKEHGLDDYCAGLPHCLGCNTAVIPDLGMKSKKSDTMVRNPLARCETCRSNDEMRQTLNNVIVSRRNGRTECAGTDGRRLYHEDITACEKEIPWVVQDSNGFSLLRCDDFRDGDSLDLMFRPCRTEAQKWLEYKFGTDYSHEKMAELQKSLGKQGGEALVNELMASCKAFTNNKVILAVSWREPVFRIFGRWYEARMNDGVYPNYKQVSEVPQRTIVRLNVEHCASRLLSALSIAKMSGLEEPMSVPFRVDDKTFFVNPDFMLDGIDVMKSLGCREASMSYSGDRSPVELFDAGKENGGRYILMPMRGKTESHSSWHINDSYSWHEYDEERQEEKPGQTPKQDEEQNTEFSIVEKLMMLDTSKDTAIADAMGIINTIKAEDTESRDFAMRFIEQLMTA